MLPSMLSLDDPRWETLTHAYGAAADTPSRLRELATGAPSEELTEALWSSLWHQGDVYTASYAAAPHVVEAAATMVPEQRLQWLVLALGIGAAARQPGAPPVPDDLAPGMEGAAARGRPLVSELVSTRQWDAADCRYVTGLVAIVAGHPQFGLELFGLDGGIPCPSCEAEIDLLEHFGIAVR
jgi:hypothetical protein